MRSHIKLRYTPYCLYSQLYCVEIERNIYNRKDRTDAETSPKIGYRLFLHWFRVHGKDGHVALTVQIIQWILKNPCEIEYAKK